MFENVGGKIKGVAQFSCWIGIISFVIIGILSFRAIDEGGILIMIIGPFFSWLSSLSLYGFGQLIEDMHKIAEGQETGGKYSNPGTANRKAHKTVLQDIESNLPEI